MVYLFSLLLQNIECGYSLEPPPRGGSTLYPQSTLWAKRKISKNIHFNNSKNLCISHGHIFVMSGLQHEVQTGHYANEMEIV